MNSISIFTVISSVFNFIKELKKTKTEKNQSVEFINEIALLGVHWWERKIKEVVEILYRGSEDKPVYIGELAYCIKTKELLRFRSKENCRVNQILDLIMKALWELDLVCIKANAVLLGEELENSEAKNTTYGLWWNPKYYIYDLDVHEWERGLREGTPESITTEGMFGNKYVKEYGKGKDHCREMRKLLNDVEFILNKELLDYCNLDCLPENPNKRKAFELYEQKILKKIKAEDIKPFHNEYKPDSRGRFYIDNDVGNYIGLRSIRGLIKFAKVEIADPNVIED